MKYYLDTNTIIYAIKGTYPSIKEHFKTVPFESIVIPNIVVAEIEYGAQKSINYEKTIEVYNNFINNFERAIFDEFATNIYGEIRADLEKKGNIIGPNDLIIASIVLANNGILITHNVKEFSRIKNLKIEDWTEKDG